MSHSLQHASGEALGLLAEEAWRLYHQAEASPFVVRPSIPILFFGDSQRYFRSALKVITVGLNPSLAEFPADAPFMRFPQAEHVYPDILRGQNSANYLHALNDYFRYAPYRRWFRSFEPLLNGMGSSYYDGQINTVLHTDLCSPLATNPTWSRLTDEKARLEVEGVPLWHRLVRHLTPDVILVSIARRYLAQIDFTSPREWETIYTVERANPYRVGAREIAVTGGKRTLLVFGQAANTPFGTVSNAAKVVIGHRIGEHARGR